MNLLCEKSSAVDNFGAAKGKKTGSLRVYLKTISLKILTYPPRSLLSIPQPWPHPFGARAHPACAASMPAASRVSVCVCVCVCGLVCDLGLPRGAAGAMDTRTHTHAHTYTHIHTWHLLHLLPQPQWLLQRHLCMCVYVCMFE